MSQLLLATILAVAMLSIASIVTSSVALAQNMSEEEHQRYQSYQQSKI
jgi:hypothetical protein